MKKILLLIALIPALAFPQKEGFQIARLKYSGGGDWYNDPSAEVNLLNFVSQNVITSYSIHYTKLYD